MYLSRLILDPTDRHARRDLADIYQLHRSVMSGFAAQLPAEERVLFRLDEDGGGRPLLLVQSQTAPDWGELSAGYLLAADPFYLLPNPAVKQVAPVFRAGQWLRFRLRANPTVKKPAEDGGQGRRVAIVREDAQLAWLGRKGVAGGFCFDETAVRVAEPGRAFGLTRADAGGGRHRVELHVVQFDGVLQVTDAECFAATVRAGVGSGKGFGCGLLSVAPV